MKKTIAIFLTAMFLFSFVAGCGDNKVIDGKEYTTYGFLNKSEKRNPNVQYELIVGNVIWGILLVETIIAPVYFFGFSLYEPVGKRGTVEPGVVSLRMQPQPHKPDFMKQWTGAEKK